MADTISINDLKAVFGDFEKNQRAQAKVLTDLLKVVTGDKTLPSTNRANSFFDKLSPESDTNKKERVKEVKNEKSEKKDSSFSNIAAAIKSSLGGGVNAVIEKIKPKKVGASKNEIKKETVTPKKAESPKSEPKKNLITSVVDYFKPNKKETKTPYTREEINIDLPPKTKVMLEDVLDQANIRSFDRYKPYLEVIADYIKINKDKKDKKDDKKNFLKDILPMAAKLLGPILGALGTIFLGAAAAIGSIGLLFNGLMDSGPFKGLKKLLGRGGLAFGISVIKRGATKFVNAVGNFAKLFFDPKKIKAFERLMGMKAKALGKKILGLPGKLFSGIGKAVKNLFSGLTGKVTGAVVKSEGKSIIGKLAGTVGMFLAKRLKALPLIGTIISFGFAISRIAKGDIIGGLLDIASGVASAFPEFGGTALSIAIDVFSAYRDVKTGGSEKAGAANRNWMSNAWKWVKSSFMKLPLIRHLTDMGKHIREGKWGSAFIDIAEIIPGVEFIVNLFKEEKAAISDLAATGKPITFASFLKATKNAMLKAILSVLPESFGIRSGIAKLLGISGYENVKTNDTTETPAQTTAIAKSTKKPTNNMEAANTDINNNTDIPADNITPNTPEGPADNIQPATPETPSAQPALTTGGDETDLNDVHKSIKEQNGLILKLLNFMKQTADNTTAMASTKTQPNNMSVVNVSNNPTAYLTNPMGSTDFRRKAFA